jgi:hypothetical protein
MYHTFTTNTPPTRTASYTSTGLVWITYSVTAPLSRARAGALARGRPRNSGEPSGGGSAGRQAGNLQIVCSSLCSASAGASADVDPACDGGRVAFPHVIWGVSPRRALMPRHASGAGAALPQLRSEMIYMCCAMLCDSQPHPRSPCRSRLHGWRWAIGGDRVRRGSSANRLTFWPGFVQRFLCAC